MSALGLIHRVMLWLCSVGDGNDVGVDDDG